MYVMKPEMIHKLRCMRTFAAVSAIVLALFFTLFTSSASAQRISIADLLDQATVLTERVDALESANLQEQIDRLQAQVDTLLRQMGPPAVLVVTSRQTNRVLQYDGATGASLGAFVPGGGRSSAPGGLAFGPDGNLYISSLSNDRVLRYRGATGDFIDIFVASRSGGLSSPAGLVFGPDGNLYVMNGSTDEVLRYNGATGDFVDAFVPAGSGGLNGPTFLAFRPVPLP